jgi:hypothetical protein
METKSSNTDNVHHPQTTHNHPAEWERDLNPNHMAGQNIGERSSEMEKGLPTAHDFKDAHRTLHDAFEDDELKQIPILPQGQRLQQGATYLDLRDPQREEFTARGDMTASDDNWFVPKDEVPYSLWNRLLGVDNPERIAERRDTEDDR